MRWGICEYARRSQSAFRFAGWQQVQPQHTSLQPFSTRKSACTSSDQSNQLAPTLSAPIARSDSPGRLGRCRRRPAMHGGVGAAIAAAAGGGRAVSSAPGGAVGWGIGSGCCRCAAGRWVGWVGWCGGRGCRVGRCGGRACGRPGRAAGPRRVGYCRIRSRPLWRGPIRRRLRAILRCCLGAIRRRAVGWRTIWRGRGAVRGL